MIKYSTEIYSRNPSLTEDWIKITSSYIDLCLKIQLSACSSLKHLMYYAVSSEFQFLQKKNKKYFLKWCVNIWSEENSHFGPFWHGHIWVHKAKWSNAIYTTTLQITMDCTYLPVVLMVLSLLWLCSLLTFSAEEHTWFSWLAYIIFSLWAFIQ